MHYVPKGEAVVDVERPQLMAEIRSAVSVAAGNASTCARDKDRGLFCWGDFGDETIKEVRNDLQPVRMMVSGDQVSSFTLGDSHGCAVDSSGKLRCWGIGVSGQLGLGDVVRQEVAGGLTTELGVVALAAGPEAKHTCAIFENGLSRCWGDNTYGQLGYGDLVQGNFGNKAGDNINDLPFHEFWSTEARDDSRKGAP